MEKCFHPRREASKLLEPSYLCTANQELSTSAVLQFKEPRVSVVCDCGNFSKCDRTVFGRGHVRKGVNTCEVYDNHSTTSSIYEHNGVSESQNSEHPSESSARSPRKAWQSRPATLEKDQSHGVTV